VWARTQRLRTTEFYDDSTGLSPFFDHAKTEQVHLQMIYEPATLELIVTSDRPYAPS
jgi:hypothetical protein